MSFSASFISLGKREQPASHKQKNGINMRRMRAEFIVNKAELTKPTYCIEKKFMIGCIEMQNY